MTIPEIEASKKDILSEEVLLIIHSGEIPEIAYHGSIYYLTEDPEGPHLALEPKDLVALEKAVVQRYRTIILRDITPENRDKTIYRGLKRCAVNWKRLVAFSTKKAIDISSIRREVAGALKAFLARESMDVSSGKRESCINCPDSTLMELASDLGLPGEELLRLLPRSLKTETMNQRP